VDPNRQPSFFALLNPLVPIRTLWTHRQLLWKFTLRNLEMRHKGSVLGFAWAVLNPLLMLGLYIFVFGFIFGGSFHGESRWDYGLGIFLGLSIFHLVAESIAVAPSLITSNPNFVKKVVFPLEILPAAAVGAALIHMAIALAMVVVGVLIGGHSLSWSALNVLPIILPIVLLALGLAWTLSALGVFFRDINQLVIAGTTALMFASAIFYPASRVIEKAPWAWPVIGLNPILHAVEAARDVLIWSRPFAQTNILYLQLAGLAVALIGFAAFSRCKRAFADVM
jgi:lipopolysaccharide transport system permease protein